MTVSIAAWVRESVTSTDPTTSGLARQQRARYRPTQARTGWVVAYPPVLVLLAPRWRSRTGVRMGSAKDWPDRGLAIADERQKALGPLDGFCYVPGLHQRPPADELLSLGERAVQHRELAVVVLHLHAIVQRSQAASGQDHAGLGCLADELVHLLIELQAGLRHRSRRVAQGVAEKLHGHSFLLTAPDLAPGTRCVTRASNADGPDRHRR